MAYWACQKNDIPTGTYIIENYLEPTIKPLICNNWNYTFVRAQQSVPTNTVY